MNICVCMKQVPDTNQIRIDEETHTLIRKGVPSIVNPFDTLALEMGVRLKEQQGGRVVVISMGPPQAESAIRSCLAAGADAGYLISDRVFGGSDTYATSYILSGAIREVQKREGAFDLILCGKQAIDGDTAQVGPELATHLGLAQITYAIDIEIEKDRVQVKRETEKGYDVLEAVMPALVTVSSIPGEVRYPTIGSKRASKKMEIPVLGADSLKALDPGRCGLGGSPTRVRKTYAQTRRKQCRMLEGKTSAEKVNELAGLLRNANLI